MQAPLTITVAAVIILVVAVVLISIMSSSLENIGTFIDMMVNIRPKYVHEAITKEFRFTIITNNQNFLIKIQ